MALPQGTILSTPINSKWICALAEPTSGLALIIVSTATTVGAPAATANIYAPGCWAINLGGTSSTTNTYANAGTAASPSWVVWTLS